MLWRNRWAILGLALVLAPPIVGAVGVAAQETEGQRDERMSWWREARFGMFIHWGLYSIPAGIELIRNLEGNQEAAGGGIQCASLCHF